VAAEPQVAALLPIAALRPAQRLLVSRSPLLRAGPLRRMSTGEPQSVCAFVLYPLSAPPGKDIAYPLNTREDRSGAGSPYSLAGMGLASSKRYATCLARGLQGARSMPPVWHGLCSSKERAIAAPHCWYEACIMHKACHWVPRPGGEGMCERPPILGGYNICPSRIAQDNWVGYYPLPMCHRCLPYLPAAHCPQGITNHRT